MTVLTCDGCGACCREVDSPRGYAVVAAAQDDPTRLSRMAASAEWAGDLACWEAMPSGLREGLAAFYRTCGPAGDRWAGRPCLW